MPIYTIRQIGDPGAANPGRRIDCQTDHEALALAQRMSETGLKLEVWRENRLIGAVISGRNGTAA